MKRLFGLLVVLALLSGAQACAVNTAASDEAAAFADAILAYNAESAGCADAEEWVLRELLGKRAAAFEWYALALHQFGVNMDAGAAVDAVEEVLSRGAVLGATTKLKYALTLAAFGAKEHDFVREAAEEAIGAQGIMSCIYGLHLLNNGLKSKAHDPSELVDTLLGLRKADGGWALMGNKGDVDVTAMTLQALAPYAGKSEEVDSAVSEALSCLARAQVDAGQFIGFGGVCNAESTAQVIIALCALGIDPAQDERFITPDGRTPIDGLRVYLLPGGGYCHLEGEKVNATATLQAFEAYVALWRLRGGKSPLFVFDAPEQGVRTRAAQSARRGTGYKPIALGALGFLVLASCGALYLRGKRKWKSYLFVMLVFSALAAVVVFTDISGAGDYYSGAPTEKGKTIGSVTMTVRCDTVKDRLKSGYIPSDGVILPLTRFELAEGETVYDIMTQAARQYRLQMDSRPSSGMMYIAGISYLYEFDYGDLSGWIYHVNGVTPSVGCNDYALSDGDVIEWLYTLDLGEDVRDFSALEEAQ